MLAMDPMQATHLIHSVYSEVQQVQQHRDNEEIMHRLRMRLRMLIARIFGDTSHYMHDLEATKEATTGPWDTPKNRLRDLCQIMLEDIRLTEQERPETSKEAKATSEPSAQPDRDLRVQVAEIRNAMKIMIERLGEYEKTSDGLPEVIINTSHPRDPLADYVIIDLPDAEKSSFHDLLKGFEDFAAIKGYKVTISVDASRPNQFAFKFTFGSRTTPVTSQTLSADLADYISRVEKGDELNDLPVILPEPQHQALLFAMRNRITFLHFTIKQKDNLLKWHDKIFESQTKLLEMLAGKDTSPIHVQLIQENKPTITQSLVVGSTPEEREKQVAALESLKQAIQDHAQAKIYVRPLENVQEELKEERPDPQRIAKWLETAKHGLKALALTKEVYDAALVTYAAFKMLF